MGRIVGKSPSDAHVIVGTGPHSTLEEHETLFGTTRYVTELVLLAVRKLDPHILGVERIVVRDGMLEVLHLTKPPLRDGCLILLDGRLALQGICLRFEGKHLIAKRHNRGIRRVNLLTQEFDVLFALPVLLPRAPVLDDPANDRHNERENECGELDAVL